VICPTNALGSFDKGIIDFVDALNDVDSLTNGLIISIDSLLPHE
jgi:hypothetical protein